MKTNQKFHFSVILKKSRKTDKGLPCYLKISVDGARAEIRTPYLIHPKNWDAKNQKVKTLAPQAQIINNYVETKLSELNRISIESTVTNQMITAKELKNRILGIAESDQPKKKTICDAFDYHNQKMEQKVKAEQITRKTLLRYKSAKQKVIDFMKHEYRIEDKQLEELRLAFITEFEHYLLTEDELKQNTAHKIVKIVKKIMNQAVALDWIPSNPFNQFKCSYKSPDRIVLTQTEIDLLRNKKIMIPRLDQVRDVFIFQCYTGFAYTDLYNFTRDAVTIGIDGEYWLSTYRQKTGTKENVPLLPVALEIIEKYRNHKECLKNNQLLPVNSNYRYNAYLQELADVCGIKKKITTHIARHTFATTVTLSNGVPIETVSKLLGHTRIATTQIYAKVLEKKVGEDMLELRKKLNSSNDSEKNLKKVSST